MTVALDSIKMAAEFRGIIIEESLEDKDLIKEVKILSTKVDVEDPNDIWHMHKVSVEGDKLPETIKKLQKSMTSLEPWYAHFYRGKSLVVIFKNKKFLISTDKNTWEPVIRYGLSLGIPREELDFKPCRIEEEEW